MRYRRRRIQYYNGETTRERLRDKAWFPFVIVAAAALIAALILGAILGGIAKDSRLSSGERKDLVDFGGAEAPEKKYAGLLELQGDILSIDGMNKEAFRGAISDLADGNAVGVPIYDGAGGVYFETALAGKSHTSFAVKAPVTATELADAALAKNRYGLGLFVTGAFAENDAQLRILRISEEIALLSELSAAGVREIMIIGFPTDSDQVTEVNSYMRQAREACPAALLSVAVASEDAESSGISRLVACTEAYVDSYYLDLRDVADGDLASLIERNAYFLTAYNMRLMLSGTERDALIAHIAQYGITSYLVSES